VPQICPADIVVVYKVDCLTRAQVASAAPWFAPDAALEGNGFEPSVPRCARTTDSAALV
jgi:hypothetical protein